MKREAEKKVENLENRGTARIDHTSSLQVQDIASEKSYKARMFNYSKEGFYFESDSVLNPGIQIYIGIKNSPYASLPDVLEYRKLFNLSTEFSVGSRTLSKINSHNQKELKELESSRVKSSLVTIAP